jgi:thiosulfate/3-mercaptopyruvate sulfurtransferase
LGDRAALLDGGLAAWRGEGRPLSTVTPPIAPATFTSRPRLEAVADADWLRSRLGDVTLLDARTPDFHSGANAGGMPRAGHIPGARNIPFNTLWNAERKWKPAAALREMLPAARPVVTYCHIGQQATVLYFAARYLGLEARLYDGSFQDWSSRAELPVESAP